MKETEKRQITIRLPSELIERLQRKADETGISLNVLIAALLSEYMSG